MAFSKIESVWKLMTDYRLIFEENKELTCTICKNIMKEPCSSLCGCHYCYSCVVDFIGNETKYCPGSKKNCRDTFLLFDGNVSRNFGLSKKISEVNVNCPHESCLCNIPLIELEDHLRLCTKKPFECPFVALGCKSEKVNLDTIVTHFNNDALNHSEFMIDLLQNLRNEVSGLKDEVRSLKENSINKNNIIMTLEDLLREMEIRINGERNERKEEVNDLKIEIEEIKTEEEKEMTRLKNEFAESTLEIVTLREQSKMKESRIVEEMEKRINIERNERKEEVNDLKRQIEEIKTEEEKEMTRMKNEIAESTLKIATLREESKMTEKEVNDLKIQIEEMRTEEENEMTIMRNDIAKNKLERNKKEEETEARLDRWIKLCPIIDADFVWRIEDISKKMNGEIFSESFHHNNYKLCLGMYIYNSFFNDNILLYCHIMMDDNDDNVQWPLKRSITISIIDQYTLRTYKSETYQSNFKRVLKERGTLFISLFSDYVGSSFIKYSSIKDKSSIINNDSIIVSVVVSPV